MNEGVLRQDDAVACRLHTRGVVVVLEEPDLEALVERPHRLEDVMAKRHAEHRRNGHVGEPPVCFDRPLLRELEHLAVRAIRRLDLRLVSGLVRHRPDEADRLVMQGMLESLEPAGWNKRVVVQEHEQLAARGSETLIDGAGETSIRVVLNRVQPS